MPRLAQAYSGSFFVPIALPATELVHSDELLKCTDFPLNQELAHLLHSDGVVILLGNFLLVANGALFLRLRSK